MIRISAQIANGYRERARRLRNQAALIAGDKAHLLIAEADRWDAQAERVERLDEASRSIAGSSTDDPSPG